MAQRDQLARALGRLDAGDARRAQHVALGRVSGDDRPRGGRRHAHQRLRGRRARGDRLVAHVDHPRVAGVVEVGELGHG